MRSVPNAGFVRQLNSQNFVWLDFGEDGVGPGQIRGRGPGGGLSSGSQPLPLPPSQAGTPDRLDLIL